MTAHQHENIARGSNAEFRRNAQGKVANSIDKLLYYDAFIFLRMVLCKPTSTGTYLGDRLGNKKVTTTNYKMNYGT